MGNLGVPEGLTRLSLSHHEPLALPGAPRGCVGHGAVPAAARAPTAATTRLSASQVAAPCREINKKKKTLWSEPEAEGENFLVLLLASSALCSLKPSLAAFAPWVPRGDFICPKTSSFTPR